MTKDGHRMTLMVNAGLRDDVAALDLTGADGIGLFRTEFQFLVSATLPQRERQQRLYKDVLDAAGDRPVDIPHGRYRRRQGAALSQQDEREEENPAMGWRALRLALERDGLMKAQARALIEAAAGRTLNVMFPMVSEAWEFDEAQGVVRGAARLAGGARARSCRSRSAMARCSKCPRSPNCSTCCCPSSTSCRSAPTT